MEFEYVIDDGEVIIIGYVDRLAEHIIIPEFIEGYPVTCIDSGCFSYVYNLKTIIIPPTIRNISSYAFGNLCGLMVNGLEISNARIINDKFIVDPYNFLTILNQIGDDYVIKSDLNNYYLIGMRLCMDNFEKSIKMEIKDGF
jgi:hypothetical protein